MFRRNARICGKGKEVCRTGILLEVGKKVMGKGLWSRIRLPYTNRG
jgi:hypothetical protein